MYVCLGYYFSPESVSTPEQRLTTLHRVVEAFKMGYAKRSFLGDEDFVDVAKVGDEFQTFPEKFCFNGA